MTGGLLSLLLFCLPAFAQTVRPAFSPTLRALENEAAKDPSGQPKAERAKTEAAEAYTGEGPTPFHVELLSPVELLEPEQVGRPLRPAAKPSAPAASDGRPSYHFEGRTPIGGLTIYTPVRDEEGADNSTRSRAGSGGGFLGFLKGIGKWLAIAAGVALIAVAGPVGIAAGAALVAGGAWLALKKD